MDLQLYLMNVGLVKVKMTPNQIQKIIKAKQIFLDESKLTNTHRSYLYI